MTDDELLNIYYEQLANANDARFTGDWRMAEAFGMFESIFLLLVIKLCKPTSNGGRIIDGERWVYNTYEGWQEKFFRWRSIPAIKNSVLKLEKEGYLLSCQPDSFDRKKYYRPNQIEIMRKLAEMYPTEFPNKRKKAPIDGIKNIPSMGQNLSHVNRNTLNTDTKTNEEEERNENFNSSIQKQNQETAKVFKSYESEIGVLTSLIGNEIKAFLEQDNVSPDWIIAAIEEASRNNKRSWSYISAIIKRWQVEGFQSSNKPESKSSGKPQAKSKAKPQTAGRYVPEHEESQTIVKGGTTYFIEGKNRLAGDDVELQF